jgi:hypothetical protein
VPEIRHLLACTVLLVIPVIDTVLAWSNWRRHHQLRALVSSYRHHGDPIPPHLRL